MRVNSYKRRLEDCILAFLFLTVGEMKAFSIALTLCIACWGIAAAGKLDATSEGKITS